MAHTDAALVESHVFYLKAGDGLDLFADADVPTGMASGSGRAMALVELAAWLDAHRIDVMHTHSFRPNLYARMAGAVLKPGGLRIVAHYHNDYEDKWHGDVLTLERRLAGITDACVAVSEAVAEHVATRIGARAEVIANGIDHARVAGGSRLSGRRALGLGSGDYVVGLVGRICRQKGVDTFVEAALRLGGDGDGRRFVVVGDEEDAGLVEHLGRRIREAGQVGRIKLVGHRDDMADVLAALDCVAAPSRWEGFGLALAEAMAAGVPVIASEVGGIPFVVGDAACLVPAEGSEALARAISSLQADPARRARMRTAGLARAARFDWSRSAAQLTALYARTVRAR